MLKADEIRVASRDHRIIPDLAEKYPEADIILEFEPGADADISHETLREYDILCRKKFIVCLNDISPETLAFYHDNDIDNLFSSQSKLRPSILEEFVFILFRDYVNDLIDRFDADSIINSGSAKAYTNLFFRAKDFQEFIKAPQIGVNQKDQDYSIYRELSISIDGKNTKIKIPVVAVETKTYIDKTMLDSIIATAEKLKNGTPHSKFIAVTESYEVDKNVDPAYSRIDQIYVLRKSNNRDSWNQISEDVVFRLFNDVKDHIERPWSDIETKMKKEGVIL